MKEHFIVKLYPDQNRNVEVTPRYWKDFILDKSLTVESFYPEFNNLFRENNLKFWLTKEYKPAQNHTWSNDEVDAGFDRIYRVILQQDYEYPDRLIKQIKLLRGVEVRS